MSKLFWKIIATLQRSDHGSAMVEAAIVMPVVLLSAFALINMALAGFASVNASNAANYGARVGSVAQKGQSGIALAAANKSVKEAGIGQYSVHASGGGRPGAQILVDVEWKVANIFAGLASFFGGSFAPEIAGLSRVSFRQEGW